ncbi:DUF481 domain-containing protein [Hydrogenimonas sp.]|uniref:DUF481 domain-containing protein n=1 Tax=Hydrogenimonas sp. TaxID=2231112 RepID=UPI002613F84A|nr:DUF481 domain-containing protein [Hydrogenimonas sp.]
MVKKLLVPILVVSSLLYGGEENATKIEESGKLEPGQRLENVTHKDIVEARQKVLEEKATTKEQKEELKLRKKAQKIDTIVVKGTVLQGRITELTSKYIEFSLVYGTGSIRIEYKNIEQLTTEHEYHIFYKGKETTGRIVGIKDHAFLVVKHGELKELIKVENIDRLILSVKENDTIENRLRNMFPYTHGSLDIGVETETGVKDKRKISIDYHGVRKKMNQRQILEIHYAYETTTTAKPEGSTKSLDKKELYITGEQNLLIDKKQFLFAQLGYDFDQPRSIRYRLYPAIGYGYRFIFDHDTWIQLKGGAGYVYESFYSYDVPPGQTMVENNDYSAAFIGVSAKDHLKNLWLIRELILSGNIFYMPSLVDPSADWLSRMTFTVEIPISAMLSLKWVYRIVNDDNPVPEVGNNKTTTDIYLSIRY